VDLGEVYALVDRPGDADAALRDALTIIERKGGVPLADRVRAKLAAVEAGA